MVEKKCSDAKRPANGSRKAKEEDALWQEDTRDPQEVQQELLKQAGRSRSTS